jgi:hypothetical protein
MMWECWQINVAGGYFQTGGVGEVVVLPTRLHIVTSQKTIIWTFTAMKTLHSEDQSDFSGGIRMFTNFYV